MRPKRGFIRELWRKVVHLAGLLIPLVYAAGLQLTSGGQPLLTRRSATIGLGIVTGLFFVLGMRHGPSAVLPRWLALLIFLSLLVWMIVWSAAAGR